MSIHKTTLGSFLPFAVTFDNDGFIPLPGDDQIDYSFEPDPEFPDLPAFDNGAWKDLLQFNADKIEEIREDLEAWRDA